MNVLKKINKMRLDRGWSVYRLSVESGVPQSTITNMINRETSPSIATLEAICSAFGITMAEFFAEEKTDSSVPDDKILSLFNSMSDDTKQIVVELMKKLAKL